MRRKQDTWLEYTVLKEVEVMVHGLGCLSSTGAIHFVAVSVLE